MSVNIQAEFWYTQITLPGEQIVTFPLRDHDSVWLGTNGLTVAQRYSQRLEKYFVEENEYAALFRQLAPITFEQHSIEVKIPKKADKFPEHDMHFVLMVAQCALGGVIGVAPQLGIEVYAGDINTLQDRMRDNILLEYTRNKRMADVAKLLPLFWEHPMQIGHVTISPMILDPQSLRALSKQKTKPLLPQVTQLMRGRARPVIRLDAALQQLTRNLTGAYPQSTLLVGPAGSGKTALIRYFVCEVMKLRSLAFRQTNAAKLITKLTGDTGWQKQLGLLCQELRDEKTVLYVDHLWELFEVGQYSGNQVSMGDFLREPLQRGDIILVAECTEEELSRIELRAPAYTGLFQQVRLPSLLDAEHIEVINSAVGAIAQQNQVILDDKAVDTLIRLTQRFMPYSGMPGKPIRFLESVILNQRHKQAIVDNATIINAYCEETGMPNFIIDPEKPLNAASIQSFFHSRIFGQPHAIEIITNLLLAVKTSLTRKGKPIATLLFAGTTGVGKTEMAKALALYLFGDARRLIRLDMSEYQTMPAVMRLTGDAGGEGVLTQQVRQTPFSVVLFDELEKSDASFYDLLLQILGEGRLTDHQGQVVDFCSSVIIMTSNIGARQFQSAKMGFVSNVQSEQQTHQFFDQAVQAFFRPELFNRLDHIIPFSVLGAAQRQPIVARELSTIKRREGLQWRNVQLHIDEGVHSAICAKVDDPKYGARHMQRLITEQVITPMAHTLCRHPFQQPLQLTVSWCAPSIVIDAQAQSSALQAKLKTQANSALALADKITQERRLLNRVSEGPVYLDMQSRLSRFLFKQKKLQQAFWEDAQSIHAFEQLNNLQQTFTALAQRIIETESQQLLHLSGIDATAEPPHSVLTQWRQDWLTLRMDLLMQHQPEIRYCSLGLYGAPDYIDDILSVYLGMAEHQGYDVQQHDVWWKEKDKQYKRDVASNREKNDQRGHQLIGREWQCAGPCCALFFLDEKGVHHWEGKKEKTFAYYLHVQAGELTTFNTPAGVHRKTFYDGKKPRRVIHQNGFFSDKPYKAEGLYGKKHTLEKILQDRLIQQLDQQLLP